MRQHEYFFTPTVSYNEEIELDNAENIESVWINCADNPLIR